MNTLTQRKANDGINALLGLDRFDDAQECYESLPLLGDAALADAAPIVVIIAAPVVEQQLTASRCSGSPDARNRLESCNSEFET